MVIKKIKKITVGSITFDIKWNSKHGGGSFDYSTNLLEIGTAGGDDRTFEVIMHELSEMLHCNQHTRFQRTDIHDDFLFVTDHRQFDAHNSHLAGLIKQFIL